MNVTQLTNDEVFIQRCRKALETHENKTAAAESVSLSLQELIKLNVTLYAGNKKPLWVVPQRQTAVSQKANPEKAWEKLQPSFD